MSEPGGGGQNPSNVSLEDAIARAKALAAKFLKAGGSGALSAAETSTPGLTEPSKKRELEEDDVGSGDRAKRRNTDIRPGVDYTPLPTSITQPNFESGTTDRVPHSQTHQRNPPAFSRPPVAAAPPSGGYGGHTGAYLGAPGVGYRGPPLGGAAPWASAGGGPGGSDFGRGPPGESLTLSIPAARVGLVIGRRGASINELQDRTGAKITVQPDHMSDRGSRDRPVTLQGTKDAIDHAKRLIMEIVEGTGGVGNNSGPPMDGAGGVTETITVPHESAGYIIGKGGEVIKSISSSTNVHIQVDPPVAPGQTQRNVHMTGSREGIEMAKQMIFERMKTKGKSGHSADYIPFSGAHSAINPSPISPHGPGGVMDGSAGHHHPHHHHHQPHRPAHHQQHHHGGPSISGDGLSVGGPTADVVSALVQQVPQTPQEAAQAAANHYYRLYGYYYPPEYLAQYYASFFGGGGPAMAAAAAATTTNAAVTPGVKLDAAASTTDSVDAAATTSPVASVAAPAVSVPAQVAAPVTVKTEGD